MRGIINVEVIASLGFAFSMSFQGELGKWRILVGLRRFYSRPLHHLREKALFVTLVMSRKEVITDLYGRKPGWLLFT